MRHCRQSHNYRIITPVKNAFRKFCFNTADGFSLMITFISNMDLQIVMLNGDIVNR